MRTWMVWGENCGQKKEGVAWLHAASEIEFPQFWHHFTKTIAKHVAWAAYLRSKEAGACLLWHVISYGAQKLLIAGRWKNLSWWATFAAFSKESVQMMKVSQNSSCRRPGALSLFVSLGVDVCILKDPVCMWTRWQGGISFRRSCKCWSAVLHSQQQVIQVSGVRELWDESSWGNTWNGRRSCCLAV